MIDKTIAILVNYNNYQDTIEAVNSLLDQSYSFYKIIVVDNCSNNSSFLELKNKFNDISTVNLIKSDKNGGFAYGNNFGIKYALEVYEFDFILMINNDTISDNNMLMYFIQYYNNHKNKNIGILTGCMYYYDKPDVIWFAGGYFSKIKCMGCHDKLALNDYEREISFATGCLWFFHKDLINKIGLLPEEYFMYLEDVDFSLKVTKYKYSIMYLPQVKIWHKCGASLANNTKKIKTCYNYTNRNRIILAKKYFSTAYCFYLLMFLCFSRLLIFVKYLKKGIIVNVYSGIIQGIFYKKSIDS